MSFKASPNLRSNLLANNLHRLEVCSLLTKTNLYNGITVPEPKNLISGDLRRYIILLCPTLGNISLLESKFGMTSMIGLVDSRVVYLDFIFHYGRL